MPKPDRRRAPAVQEPEGRVPDRGSGVVALPAPGLRSAGFRVAGLFSGIGGLELGLHAGGHTTSFLCELDADARAVLAARFPGVPTHTDVETLKALPEVDCLAAGFPCADVSQVGRTLGIDGAQTGLVKNVFRLLGRNKVEWVLLENVPFLLRLNRGAGMRLLVDRLEALGYTWAYRVVDTQSFGLPQRRRRLFLLASLHSDPRTILHVDDVPATSPVSTPGIAHGFYWTEGSRGLGWTVDAVPPLKGGSGLALQSQPAVWFPDGSFAMPEIRDGERLQGFPHDWTAPASHPELSAGVRWRLVGNAVSVPVSGWIGRRLADPGTFDAEHEQSAATLERWPEAAWGARGKIHAVRIGRSPVRPDAPHLTDFLEHPTVPLSHRAAAGFLRRAEGSSLSFAPGFIESLREYVAERVPERGQSKRVA